MGSAIYAQSQAAGEAPADAAGATGGPGAGAKSSDDDVVEAEIVDDEPKREGGAA